MAGDRVNPDGTLPPLVSKADEDEWLNNDTGLVVPRYPVDTETRPSLGTSVLERMLVDIANGEPKPANLTPDENDMWNNLVKEVREIRARGGQIDIPYR